MPANENALSTSIKLKKVKKYDDFLHDFLQMVTFYSRWLFTVGDFLQMVTFYRCDFLPTPRKSH
jgi:hypothetical protein